MTMLRAAAAFLIGALAAPALVAQPAPTAPVIKPPPPVPKSSEQKEARALHKAYCSSDSLTIRDPQVPDLRLGFATDSGQPARIILCTDRGDWARAVTIDSIDTALVFMAYRPFAPFWPAAEARWGADLSRLRDDIRAIPIEQSIASYPYASLMVPRYARAMAASRNATNASDHAKARALVEREIGHIAMLEEKRPGKNDLGFELSLLIGRLANLHAREQGPSAGADLMRDLLSRHRLPEEYRTNTDINHAALLAEAGRADEAYAVIAPLMADFQVRQEDIERYKIPGSVREFSWIMACTLHLKGDTAAAVPYAAVVNAYDQQPIDPYVTWTKSSLSIQLRMNKCTASKDAYLAAIQRTAPGILSTLWIELQDNGRPIIGHYRFDGVAGSDEARALSADYRQLPESYWPALKAWMPHRAGV